MWQRGGDVTAEEAQLAHQPAQPEGARRKGSVQRVVSRHRLPMLAANPTKTTRQVSSENASCPSQTHEITFCLRILRFPGTLTLNVCVSPNSYVEILIPHSAAV